MCRRYTERTFAGFPHILFLSLLLLVFRLTVSIQLPPYCQTVTGLAKIQNINVIDV